MSLTKPAGPVTIMYRTNKERKEVRQVNKEDLKKVLGEDYEPYMEFKARENARRLKKRARELAQSRVEVNPEWKKANAILDELWAKELAKANEELGVVE